MPQRPYVSCLCPPCLIPDRISFTPSQPSLFPFLARFSRPSRHQQLQTSIAPAPTSHCPKPSCNFHTLRSTSVTMGRERRQPRCACCIKQRKQCDAAKPRCGLCTTMKKACVYPEGMPSRREYLEMEARQQAQHRGEQGSDEMDVDEDNVMERADGRGRGQESPSFTQLQPLAPHASLRGGNREHLTSAYPSLYGSPSGVFTLSAGTIPVTAQQVHPYSQYTDSSHAEGQYMPQQSQTAQRGTSSFDTNAGNHIARFYTPARQSLILDGPFSSDPPPIPDAAQDVLQTARSQVPATINQTLDTGMFFFAHISHACRVKNADMFLRTATA